MVKGRFGGWVDGGGVNTVEGKGRGDGGWRAGAGEERGWGGEVQEK